MFNYIGLLETEKEREFFQKIYEEYRNAMYHVAYGILNNKSDAEDMVHETFLTLIDNLDKIKENDCHKTWNYIVTILKNKSINLYHKKRRRQTGVLEEWDALEVFAKDIQTEAEEREVQEILIRLLGQMKYPYREVLTMQYYQDMSAAEIAHVLGKTPDNIRHISQRARKKLQQMLEERGIGDEDNG